MRGSRWILFVAIAVGIGVLALFPGQALVAVIPDGSRDRPDSGDGGIASLAMGRGAWSVATSTPQPFPPGDGPWVVRATYDDREMVDDLAAWKEPWDVIRPGPGGEPGYVIVDVTREQARLLLQAGFRLEVDERLTELFNRPTVRLEGQMAGIPGYPCYRTVEETFATAEAIAAAHPDLAVWIDIGDSWEKTQDPESGYDLRVLRLTQSGVAGPKPKLFVMASMHAREYAPAELLTRFAEYMVERYDVDPDVTWLLDHHEIHLLLQANPDGRKRAETGLSWRKNADNQFCANTNLRGVDLNRNFEFGWACCGGSSYSPCSETFHGPTPGSEPETKAIQSYLRAQFPDQREDDPSAAAPITATGVVLDLHSYGEWVLWPWGSTSAPSPNQQGLRTLGHKLAYWNGYTPDQAAALYPTDGTIDGFSYGTLGLASFTLELGTSFFQDCPTFEGIIWPDNLSALIYAAKVARAPYALPSGPDARDLAVLPAAVPAGERVQVKAVVDDTRYSQENGTEPVQPIAAAEYYVDVPPWVPGTIATAHTMAAVDGGFDGSVETVEGELDTSGLSEGRHTLLIRGRDRDGNWGAWSAVFFYVVEPGVSPTIRGYVREAGTYVPLSATLAAGGFEAKTDAQTGYYEMTVVSGTYDLSAAASGHAPVTAQGLTIAEGQNRWQDFVLPPVCDAFADDAEAGDRGWTAQLPWSISAEAAHGGARSWTDSPGGDYANNRDAALISPVLDLSGMDEVTLSFWHRYAIEPGYDYGYVEVSADGGTSWTQVTAYSGYEHGDWLYQTLSLPDLAGQLAARFRFHLVSDGSVTADGWYLDDIVLSGTGHACAPDGAWVSFVSSSPDWLGQTTVFTDATMGIVPVTWAWTFGDGTPAVHGASAAHVYAAPGVYTATLSASADGVTRTFSQPVTIYGPPTARYALPVPIWAGAAVQLENRTRIIPARDPEVTYEWSFGDGSLLSTEVHPKHKYGLPGGYTLSLTATNPAGQSVTQTAILVYNAGVAVEPPLVAGVDKPGSTISYLLRVANTGTYTDAFDLTPRGAVWPAEIVPSVLPELGPGAAGSITVSVGIPNDALAGDWDVLSIRFLSRGDKITSQTVVLTTTASAVYGVEVIPHDSIRYGTPGTAVEHRIYVLNRGNTADEFILSLNAGRWPARISSPLGSLAPGTGASPSVTVTIPLQAQIGDTDVVTLTVASSGNGTRVGIALLTTAVSDGHTFLPWLIQGR